MKRIQKRFAVPALLSAGAALGVCRAETPPADPLGEVRGHLKQIADGQSALLLQVKTATEDAKAARDQVTNFQNLLNTAQGEVRSLTEKVDGYRRQMVAQAGSAPSVRPPGGLSNDIALALGAHFFLGAARSYGVEVFADRDRRERILTACCQALGIETRAALTTTDIPLPIQYSGQIRELIQEFGVCRKEMFPFPIGLGTSKPPRFKTRPSFGSIAMSAAVAEKSPQIDFASLESHKIGGIVRIPRELDEQSIVPMGQFIARYAATEFARAEDTWGFLADGSGTYESVKGVAKICEDNAKDVQMTAGNLAPSDATLTDFRALRLKTSSAVFSARAKYYLHSTWESRLRTFNTEADAFVFVPNATANRGAVPGPTLDGYPIVWVDVLDPYSTTDAANKYIAFFGSLEHWWMGERGTPRIEFSRDVYFTTDEIGARCMEEIDFDYQDLGAMSVLQTSAS